MDLLKEYNSIIKNLKISARQAGTKLNNDEIASRLGLSRTYLSALLNGSTPVNKKHVEDLKAHFSAELRGMPNKPALSGDQINRERALIKMLMHRLAKAEAKLYSRPLEDVLQEMEADTTLYLNDLERV